MPNAKITDLPAGVAARVGNLLEVVQSVAGLPTSTKVAVEQLSYYNRIDVPPAVANAMDDEFNAVSLDAKWVWRNQGTATATLVNGCLNLFGPRGTINCRIIEQNLPAAPWEFTLKCSVHSTSFAIPNYFKTGLCLVDSASGRVINLGSGNNGAVVAQVVYLTNVSTFLSAPFTTFTPVVGQAYYYRIADNGTNYTYSLSLDGVVWLTMFTASRTAHLAAANKVGIMVSSENAGVDAFAVCDWFRRTA